MLVYLQTLDFPSESARLESIYLENRKLLMHIAYGIVHNQEDAEDAVHYAFVKLAENLHKLDGESPDRIRGYIVTVVENKAIDIYRHKQAHPQLEYVDEVGGMEVTYDGENALVKCILKLPVMQQNVVILKYSYGYSNWEIARQLGLSYANVQKLDQRAKAKLKVLCEQEGIVW